MSNYIDNLSEKIKKILFLEKPYIVIVQGDTNSSLAGAIATRKINYKKGICPNAEFLNDKSFIGLNLCNFDYSEGDLNYIIKCFKYIWKKKILFC